MHRRREMYLQAQEKANRGYIGVAKCICEGSKKQREDAAAAACSLLYREERRIAELLKISSEEVRKVLKKAGESI